MVDYCYVSDFVSPLADVNISFDEAYPLRTLPLLFNGNHDTQYGTHYYLYDILQTNSVLPPGGELASLNPQLVGQTIVAFCIRQYDSIKYSQKDIVDSIGICYYAIGFSDSEAYWKLAKSDIPVDIDNPFDNPFVIEGEGIDMLVSMGQNLINTAQVVYEFLTYDIGGTNLITILFGGGFMIYVAWVIIKWVTPV